MKRVSDHLLVTIERIVFGRVNPTTCQTVPLLKRNDFHLVPTEDTGQEEEEKKSNDTHNLDPITLEEFKDETFIFRFDAKSPGIKYNVTSILDYIASSKELVDPVTRIPLKPRDINLLDRKAIKLGLTPVTISCRRRRKAQLKEVQTKQIISNLEAILGGLVSELLSLIETKMSQFQVDSQITIIFSEFSQPFEEYKELNLEASYMALSSWKVFLQGSPRRPTADVNGKMKMVLDFLSGLWTKQDQDALLALRQTCSSTDL